MSPQVPRQPLPKLKLKDFGPSGDTCTGGIAGIVKLPCLPAHANACGPSTRGCTSTLPTLPSRRYSTSSVSPSSTPFMNSSSILLAAMTFSALSTSPLTAVMTSPVRKPASSAGLFGDTAMILTPSTGSPPSEVSMFTPMRGFVVKSYT